MIRSILAAALAGALFAASSPGDEKPEGDESSKPISYPSSSIPKKDEQLVRASAREPVMIRGRGIEAVKEVVDYLMSRPGLAFRLIEELHGAPFSFSTAEEDNQWEMTTAGRFYAFEPLKGGERTHVLKFTFLFRFPLGIGLKTSGGGMVVIRAKQAGAEPEEETLIDYDIYLVTGYLPIDKLTKRIPFIQSGLARSDFESVLTVFTLLCESVADDPGAVAEDMAEADETFTAKEVNEFRKTFVIPDRAHAPGAGKR